jgi:hypothetical protein
MRAYPDVTPDEIIQKTDDLYSQTEGKKSNLKESKAAYNFALRFLKGFEG